MKLRFTTITVILVGIFSFSHATLYPVTGDSTTVWNEIDLLPAESHNPALAEFVQNEQPAAGGAPVETSTTSQPPAATPTAPAAAEVPSAADAATRQPAQQVQQEQPAQQVQAPPAATASADNQPQAADSTAQPPAPPQIIPGTIIITSVPDSIAIVINDVSVGITPYHATGFYPGIYEIVLYKEGYEPFRKSIDLKENGTEFITGTLQQERGALFVASVPESASVMMNDTTVGSTPFTSQPLIPGIYRLRVEAPGYTPYTEQLTVSPKLTDTLQISLLPLEKPKFTGPAGLQKSRTFRRITFGSVGVVCLAAGYGFNEMTKKKLTSEQEALANYQEAKLSESSYDERYSAYLSSTEVTDRFAAGRNIFYAVGIICAAGFAVSIPF